MTPESNHRILVEQKCNITPIWITSIVVLGIQTQIWSGIKQSACLHGLYCLCFQGSAIFCILAKSRFFLGKIHSRDKVPQQWSIIGGGVDNILLPIFAHGKKKSKIFCFPKIIWLKFVLGLFCFHFVSQFVWQLKRNELANETNWDQWLRLRLPSLIQ